MKNLNKFLIHRSKSFTQLEIDQTNQVFNDKTLQFLEGKVSTRYILSDVMNFNVSCVDAAMCIFSNLNLFLYLSVREAFCFKHHYGYTYHDYCTTKNKFIIRHAID